MAKTDKTRQLSIEQENAVDLLIQGRSDRETAEAIGVTRQTVCAWRNQDSLFAAELNARRNALWRGHADRLRSMVARALDTLESGLTEEDPKLRQSAAVHILRAATGLPGGAVANAPESPRAIEEAWMFRDLA